MPLKRVCATCKIVMGEKEGGEGISHGICPKCFRLQEIEDLLVDQVEAQAIKLFGTTEKLIEAKYVLRDGTLLGGGENVHSDVCLIEEIADHILLDREPSRSMTVEEGKKLHLTDDLMTVMDAELSEAFLDACPDTFNFVTGSGRIIADAGGFFFNFSGMPSTMQAGAISKALREKPSVGVEVTSLPNYVYLTFHRPTPAEGILKQIRDRGTKEQADLRGTTGKVPRLTSGKELEKKAVEEFGITENPLVAGYLLKDGRFLDFSLESEPKLRARDHREVLGLFSTQEIDFVREKHAYRALMMDEFMARTGAIRIMPEGCAAESPITFPTRPQARSLNDYALACKGTILLEIWRLSNPNSTISGFFTAGSADDVVRMAKRMAEHPDRFGEKPGKFILGKADWGLEGLPGVGAHLGGWNPGRAAIILSDALDEIGGSLPESVKVGEHEVFYMPDGIVLKPELKYFHGLDVTWPILARSPQAWWIGFLDGLKWMLLDDFRIPQSFALDELAEKYPAFKHDSFTDNVPIIIAGLEGTEFQYHVDIPAWFMLNTNSGVLWDNRLKVIPSTAVSPFVIRAVDPEEDEIMSFEFPMMPTRKQLEFILRTAKRTWKRRPNQAFSDAPVVISTWHPTRRRDAIDDPRKIVDVRKNLVVGAIVEKGEEVDIEELEKSIMAERRVARDWGYIYQTYEDPEPLEGLGLFRFPEDLTGGPSGLSTSTLNVNYRDFFREEPKDPCKTVFILRDGFRVGLNEPGNLDELEDLLSDLYEDQGERVPRHQLLMIFMVSTGAVFLNHDTGSFEVYVHPTAKQVKAMLRLHAEDCFWEGRPFRMTSFRVGMLYEIERNDLPPTEARYESRNPSARGIAEFLRGGRTRLGGHDIPHLGSVCRTSVDHGHDHGYRVDQAGHGSTSFDDGHAHNIIGFVVQQADVHTHRLIGQGECIVGLPHLSGHGLPKVGEGDSRDELATKTHGVPHLGGQPLHPMAQALKDRAVITNKPSDTAFVLADGTMIGFGKEGSHQDVLFANLPREARGIDRGFFLNVSNFVRETGSLRLVHWLYDKIAVEAGRFLSPAQVKFVLDLHAKGFSGETLEIEFTELDGDFHSYQDEFPSARRIRHFIQRHFHDFPQALGAFEPFDPWYKFVEGMTLEEVLWQWQFQGKKPRNAGESVMYPLEAVIPYREYSWGRGCTRIDPFEWDILVEHFQDDGWDPRDPAILFFGRNGVIRVGEGNHRLGAALEIGMKQVPVKMIFQQEVTLADDPCLPGSKKRAEIEKWYKQSLEAEKKIAELIGPRPKRFFSRDDNLSNFFQSYGEKLQAWLKKREEAVLEGVEIIADYDHPRFDQAWIKAAKESFPKAPRPGMADWILPDGHPLQIGGHHMVCWALQDGMIRGALEEELLDWYGGYDELQIRKQQFPEMDEQEVREIYIEELVTGDQGNEWCEERFIQQTGSIRHASVSWESAKPAFELGEMPTQAQALQIAKIIEERRHRHFGEAEFYVHGHFIILEFPKRASAAGVLAKLQRELDGRCDFLDGLGALEDLKSPVKLPETNLVSIRPPTEAERAEMRERELLESEKAKVGFEFIEAPTGNVVNKDKVEQEIFIEILKEIDDKLMAWLDHLGHFPSSLRIDFIRPRETMDELEKRIEMDGRVRKRDIEWEFRISADKFNEQYNLANPPAVMTGTIDDFNWLLDRFRRPEEEMRPDEPWPRGMADTFVRAWNAFIESHHQRFNESIAQETPDVKDFYTMHRVAGDAWRLAAMYTPMHWFAATQVKHEHAGITLVPLEAEFKSIERTETYNPAARKYGGHLKLNALYLEWNLASPRYIRPIIWYKEKDKNHFGEEKMQDWKTFWKPENKTAYVVNFEIGHRTAWWVRATMPGRFGEAFPLAAEIASCMQDMLRTASSHFPDGRWTHVTAKKELLNASLLSKAIAPNMSPSIREPALENPETISDDIMQNTVNVKFHEWCKATDVKDETLEDGNPLLLTDEYDDEDGFRKSGPWSPEKRALRLEAEKEEGSELEGLAGPVSVDGIQEELERIGGYAESDVIVSDLGRLDLPGGGSRHFVLLESKDGQYEYTDSLGDVHRQLRRMSSPPLVDPTSRWKPSMIRSFWFVLAAGPRYQLDQFAWIWAEHAPPLYFGARFALLPVPGARKTGPRPRYGWILANGEWAIYSSTRPKSDMGASEPDSVVHIQTGVKWQIFKTMRKMTGEGDLQERQRILSCVVLELHKMVRPGITQVGELIRTIELGIERATGTTGEFTPLFARLMKSCAEGKMLGCLGGGCFIPHLEE